MSTASFRDQVVIVTGSSSGIGEALAHRLAEAGASLVLAARNPERLAAVAAECVRRGAKATAVPTDVGEEVQCRALVEAATALHGRLDVLINNAGLGVRAAVADLPSLDLFRDVLRTNFLGSVQCTYHALPHLKRTRGRIVAVSSLAAKVPLPYFGAYTASKCALGGFFDVLRMEVEDDGVSVTTVYPDFVVSEFAANVRGADGRPRGPEAAARFYTRDTMTSGECARLILEAAADRRREATLSRRGKIVPWVRMMFPRTVDRLARKAIEPRAKTSSV
jgi:NAD(P)-dependent dehydrogenase (short-subunit alcohol dehydrogenase family)